MQLTESQLFTIEALNRIEGFAWPEGAEFYEVDGGHAAYFYGDASGAMASVRIKEAHDKTIINEIVTKAEFYSVDGWVRNTKLRIPNKTLYSRVEVLYDNGEITFGDANAVYWDENVDKWRYHKPQKQEATTEQPQKSLDQLFAERKKMMTDLSVTRSNLSIINYEIKALLTAQGWTK